MLNFFGFVACKNMMQSNVDALIWETSKISVSIAQQMPMIFVIFVNLDALAKCFGISVV